MYRPRRNHVHKLPDCSRDPAPNRHAGRVPDLPEFIGPSCAFHLGQVAVTFQHQVGDAPNVDLWDHAGSLSGERLCTVNQKPAKRCSVAVTGAADLALNVLYVSAAQSRVAAHTAWAVAVAAREPAPV